MKYSTVRITISANKKEGRRDPSYQLYLDGHLIIERQFWPRSPLYDITEMLTMLNDGNSHTIRVQDVFPDDGSVRVEKVQVIDADTGLEIPNSVSGLTEGCSYINIKLTESVS